MTKDWNQIRARTRLRPPTSSRIRFLALMMAVLMAFTHNSFSSGLTARKTRLGTCRDTRTDRSQGSQQVLD